MAVKIGHASGSETGSIRGIAGDQTGREVCTRSWYKHSKGWVTLRYKNRKLAEYHAQAVEAACSNNKIGYDQYENQDLYNLVKSLGFDPAKANKPVETDCARLQRVCIQYACKKAGMNLVIPDFYTGNMVSVLKKTALFEVLTDSKYNSTDDYLLRGDMQVTKTKGHTLTILENGSEVTTSNIAPDDFDLGDRTLRNGSEGADVKTLQTYLIELDYDCGRWGADGDFGDSTELAVREFQKDKKLSVDGIYGPKSHMALMAAIEEEVAEPRNVKITGGNCYVRSAPNTSGTKLGVVKSGTVLSYGGQTAENGWHLVAYDNRNGWVSGKYGKLLDE